jgi:RimJ/RimL family protein N-acetyltransferase
MRQLVNADLSDLRRLDSDPRVTELLLDRPVTTLVEALALVSFANTIYRDFPGLGIWHTRDHQDNFLGHFSLMLVEDTGDVEIGVKLVPSAWGKAYAIEGGRALCDYAFGRLGLTQLVGLCHPENRVVPILLKRLGFVEHGVTVHFGKPAIRLKLTSSKWKQRWTQAAFSFK